MEMTYGGRGKISFLSLPDNASVKPVLSARNLCVIFNLWLSIFDHIYVMAIKDAIKLGSLRWFGPVLFS